MARLSEEENTPEKRVQKIFSAMDIVSYSFVFIWKFFQENCILIKSKHDSFTFRLINSFSGKMLPYGNL